MMQFELADGGWVVLDPANIASIEETTRQKADKEEKVVVITMIAGIRYVVLPTHSLEAAHLESEKRKAP